MKKLICLLLACSVLLAGCAGREANPIPIYMPGDENRSCPALKAEIAQLQVDMARLLPKTVGYGRCLFYSPVFFYGPQRLRKD